MDLSDDELKPRVISCILNIVTYLKPGFCDVTGACRRPNQKKVHLGLCRWISVINTAGNWFLSVWVQSLVIYI